MNIFLYFIVRYKMHSNKEEWHVVTFVSTFGALGTAYMFKMKLVMLNLLI